MVLEWHKLAIKVHAGVHLKKRDECHLYLRRLTAVASIASQLQSNTKNTKMVYLSSIYIKSEAGIYGSSFTNNKIFITTSTDTRKLARLLCMCTRSVKQFGKAKKLLLVKPYTGKSQKRGRGHYVRRGIKIYFIFIYHFNVVSKSY